MRKGQIVGQVFIYILSIVIIASILAYGYTAISEFIARSDKVSDAKLQNDIIRAVERLSSDFGSVQRKDLALGGYLKICFVDTHDFSPPSDWNPSGLHPLIKDNIESKTGNNVFLLGDTLEKSFKAGVIGVDYPSLGPDQNFMCLNVKNNQASIRLEGKGDYVLISEWE
jgi:hypothetical protein